MARVKPIYRPGDCPADADPQTREETERLFATLFPGVDAPAIARDHAGLAIAARNPQMAIHLATISRFLAVDLPWSKRTDLRELAIQTVNLHFRSDFSFQARLPSARAAGIGDTLLAALPYWRTSELFDPEQRLVIAYTLAVVSGDVPADLFGKVVAQFGETGAVECTTVIGFWSCWAMLINATQPRFGPDID